MRYEVHTSLTSDEILQAAISFFGVELDLELQSQGPHSLSFVGGGGHLTLTVQRAAEGAPLTVELETREWDAQVQEFMVRLTHHRRWRRFWNRVKEGLG